MTPQDLLIEYEKRLSSQSFEKVKPLIHKDATFWFNDGSFSGIREIEQAFQKTFDLIKEEKYWLSSLKWISETSNSATCIYQYNWTGLIEGKQSSGNGRGTSVLKKVDGNWKIIHEHLSRDS